MYFTFLLGDPKADPRNATSALSAMNAVSAMNAMSTIRAISGMNTFLSSDLLSAWKDTHCHNHSWHIHALPVDPDGAKSAVARQWDFTCNSLTESCWELCFFSSTGYTFLMFLCFQAESVWIPDLSIIGFPAEMCASMHGPSLNAVFFREPFPFFLCSKVRTK